MHVIHARNVNDAYRSGLRLLSAEGIHRSSRNGGVLRVPGIVATQYQIPQERVLFDAQRDANPFFHLFEALWMLHGGNDVRTLRHILPSFGQFSDDGESFHGAYGHRWRHWPEYTSGIPYIRNVDQITRAINLLSLNHDDRRVVIGMWDPARDLGANSKDVPCNDLINLDVVDGQLNMAVTCRSNDIIWGCYGANAVHMSVLHEYLSTMIGVAQGWYTQISYNYHAYQQTPYRWDKFWPLAFPEDISWTENDRDWINPYELADDGERNIVPTSLVSHPGSFDSELAVLIHTIRDHHTVAGLDRSIFQNTFFRRVAIPMHLAFEFHRRKGYRQAIQILQTAQEEDANDNDWLVAGHRWIVARS